MYLKNEKGVTLIALTITIIVMIILSSVIIRSSNTHINTQKRDKLYSDIDNLNNKISKYYIEYGDIPVLSKQYCNKEELIALLDTNKSSNGVELNNSTDDNNITINPNDDDSYFIIDLEKLSGLTLNYGYNSDYNSAKESADNISTNIQDVYIINKTTHQIYYPRGIYTEDYMYYCYNLNVRDIKLSSDVIMNWEYKKDSNGRKTIITNKKIELPIGTYINYNAAATDVDGKTIVEKTITSDVGSPTDTASYKSSEKTLTEGNGASDQTFSNKSQTNGWRVIGADEETGELLIISADPVRTIENKDFNLRGIAGYVYGEQELNKVCSVFGSGYGATGARSVNVDDVNKITGYNPNNVGVYDPNQKGNGIKFGSEDEKEPFQYEDQTTYSWTSTVGKIAFTASNGKQGGGDHARYITYGFNWYDFASKKWKSSIQDTTNPKEITTLTNTRYWYYPYTLTTDSDTTGICKGLNTTSDEYKTLFLDKAGSKANYSLASSYIYTRSAHTLYGLYYVKADDGSVYTFTMYYSYGDVGNSLRGVRPVVSLKTDIELERQKDGSYNIIK